MSLLTQDIPRGNCQGMFLLAVSLTPSSVAADTSAEQTFTVNGLLVGDYVDVNAPSITAGIGIVNTRVSANNTLAIGFQNSTGSGVVPGAGTYTIVVWRPSYLPLPNAIQ